MPASDCSTSTASHSSRPDSLSSSSIVTVRDTSHQGGLPRDLVTHVSAQPPVDCAMIAARAVKVSATQPSDSWRSSSTNERSENPSGPNASAENTASWSHSMDLGRMRSDSEAAPSRLPATSFETLRPERRRSKASATPSPPKTRPSPQASPTRRQVPLLGKADIIRTSASRSEVVAPKLSVPISFQVPSSTLAPLDINTLSVSGLLLSSGDLFTPASYGSNQSDYFSQHQTQSRQKKARQPTELSDADRQTSGQRHHSNNTRSPEKIRTSQGQSTADIAANELARKRRAKEKREKDKKATLAKALERANTAVLLDNAQNYEGALAAYSDACKYLQRVTDRTSGEDDKRKLDAIRETYTSRIDELNQLRAPHLSETGKKLPPRPMSDGSDAVQPFSNPASPPPEQSATQPSNRSSVAEMATEYSSTRDTFLSDAMKRVEGDKPSGFLGPLWERSRTPLVSENMLRENAPLPEHDVSKSFVPLLQSPIHPSSPVELPADSVYVKVENILANAGAIESGPWRDTVEDTGISRSSSVHSVTGGGLRRKDLRPVDNVSHSDLDAAFDAAVEAVYEDGYELDREWRQSSSSVSVYPGRHNSKSGGTVSYTSYSAKPETEYDEEAEDERILDDLARSFMEDGFEFNVQSKSALPRESDSSTYTRSTRRSSVLSDRTTAGTSLSTLAGDISASRLSALDRQRGPSTSSTWRTEDTIGLLGLPGPSLVRPTSQTGSHIFARRSQRFSGPNLKPLTIETSGRRSTSEPRQASVEVPSPLPEQEHEQVLQQASRSGHYRLDEPDSAPDHRTSTVPSLRRLNTTASPQHSRAIPVSTISDSAGPVNADSPHSPRQLFLRKNKSSVSLRGASGPLFSPESEQSLITPLSSTFGSSQPYTPHRIHHAISPGVHGSLQSGGLHLFDTSLSTSHATSSPSAPETASPPLLEPCPESNLLRPFWLLRNIASTVTHPRGGYLTTRLFVPREAWMNRSIKLKNVEDKIAYCDLLSAALAGLGRVNTYDADAVLEQVQGFEEVMERVQATLAKKLGGDVGVQGVGSLFKDAADAHHAPAGPDGGAREPGARSSSGKSYLSSWRKLRSKSAGTTTGALAFAGRNSGGNDGVPTLPSVPMTRVASSSGPKPMGAREDLPDGLFEGPLKEYMASVARLGDAVYALDLVARQVEDPGLRHSSPTHVGLELSVRHAAEFFGFYVCRFLLADVGALVDKYVKRSSEWVNA